MQAVSLSFWTPMITSLLSALWSKQTQLEEQRVVTGAGTQRDLYLRDLGTTSDPFGFPALLPAESKREWEKHECTDEHRIRPDYGGKQPRWARAGRQPRRETGAIWGRKEGSEKARQFLYKELHLQQDWRRLFTFVVEVAIGDIRLKIPYSGQCSKMA